MAGGGVKRLPKSRYDSISSFICDHLGGKDEQTRTERYNDVDAPIDEEAATKMPLQAAGQHLLLDWARHCSCLLRDDRRCGQPGVLDESQAPHRRDPYKQGFRQVQVGPSQVQVRARTQTLTREQVWKHQSLGPLQSDPS